MDDDAIQRGPTVVAGRDWRDSDYDSFGRFAPGTREKDKQHLKTLSIFYYVMAGFSCFGAMMVLLEIPLGIFFLVTVPAGRAPGPTPAVGYFLIGVGIVGFALNSVYAYFLYLAGKGLREYKRRTLIFVMAILLCMGLPGIILGVFTIIVLNRATVKELFEHGDPSRLPDDDA